MIRIGLNSDEKREVINQYLLQNEINKIFIFYPDIFPIKIDVDVETEYVEYNDIIEYKPFYHLLEVIDNKSLLVFNECMRTQNRSELTYNCAHHYCNQTEHKIAFEHFPFIERTSDFMILLDFLNKGRYKGKSFHYTFIAEEDVKAKPCEFRIQTVDMELSDKDIKRYEIKKKQLFDNLGNSDPDTIPRQLHVFAGNFKREMIESSVKYVARNDRFSLPNVTTYRNFEESNYIVLDFPHRRIDFNDFLKKTGMKDIRFINSGLKVDSHYINEMKDWIERLGEFYAQASVYEATRT